MSSADLNISSLDFANQCINLHYMELDRLARELIRSLRRGRSQTAFSRRLGYSTNVVHTWEAGRRHPVASNFLHAAARSGVDVAAVLAEVLGGDSGLARPGPGVDQRLGDRWRRPG